jgi:hypothetical protein
VGGGRRHVAAGPAVTARRIYVDAGDALGDDPWPTAVWDTALWDDEVTRWSGLTPAWHDTSCRVRSVLVDRGRESALDTFRPGRAQIEIDNADGWATWEQGGITAGTWLRVRADDDPLFVGQVVRVVDKYEPGRAPVATVTAVDTLARLGRVWLRKLDKSAVGAGDTAAARLGRIMDAARLPAAYRMLEPGGPPLAATRYDDNALDLAQRTAVAAGGALYATLDGAVRYRGVGWLRTDPRAATVQARVTNRPTPPTPPAPVNLLTAAQADMETAGGWTFGTLSTAWAAHGAYSLDISLPAGGNAITAITAPFPAVTPGDTVTTMVTAWCSAAGRQVYATFQFLDAAGAPLGYLFGAAALTVAGGAIAHRQVVTVPAGAVQVRPHVAVNGLAAGDVLLIDAAGLFVGDVATWYPPGLPVPDGVLEVCATDMDTNGPDLEAVANLTIVSGVDEAPADSATRAEASATDEDSIAAYGKSTWSLSQLPTVDVAHLQTLAARALGMQHLPRPRCNRVELSPVADPAAGDLVALVDYGDRLEVHYTAPAGWSWDFAVHVHRIRHRITPAGDDNTVADWRCTLSLDDATYWSAAEVWDTATWDTSTWAATVGRELEAGRA